jgi:hypothetical protein
VAEFGEYPGIAVCGMRGMNAAVMVWTLSGAADRDVDLLKARRAFLRKSWTQVLSDFDNTHTLVVYCCCLSTAIDFTY